MENRSFEAVILMEDAWIFPISVRFCSCTKQLNELWGSKFPKIPLFHNSILGLLARKSGSEGPIFRWQLDTRKVSG